MKKILIPGTLLLSLIGFQSCTDSGGKIADKNDSMHDTTMHDVTRRTGNFYMEDLLEIKSEAELKQKFGADHVKYDTIWGEEGNFNFGTYLDKGTNNEVQFFWKDSLRTKGVASVSITANFDSEGEATFNNKWSSSRGIKLGMTTDDLEKLNGKSFVFSGFDWDYGGAITDWKGGKLDQQGLGAVTLTTGLRASQLPEKEYDQILGDRDVSSDNSIVKKVQPQVAKISIYKP